MQFSNYINRLPYARRSADPKGWEAYQAEENRILAQFKTDALEDVGLKGHPKAQKAFALAWEHGDKDFNAVYGWLVELADLIL